ncbi:MAG: phage protease [Planctomycetota bacterium]
MNRADKEDEAKMMTAFEQVTRERIQASLREVLTATEKAPLVDLRERLAELADRAAALELTQSTMSVADKSGSVSLLRSTALSSAKGEPASEFLLIPFGEVVVERPSAGSSFIFTRQHAESARRWFEGLGRKLAIDYEHQSLDRFNTRSDGLRPAAGWIGKLEVRADGLWATDVTWTERACELLRAGEYRYFSPVIFWTDEDQSDVAALGPVALTNDPAMCGIQPLTAARRRADETPTPVDDAGQVETAAAAETSVLHAELADSRRELELLRQRLTDQQADVFIGMGMRQGKILDSTKDDWRADFLRDAEQAIERLKRAPVLLPPGRVLTLDQHGEVALLSNQEREYGAHADTYRRWGVGPEDLGAYERAVAAGRVQFGGAG